MENNEKILINQNHQIKVKKKQNYNNEDLNIDSNDIKFLNQEIQAGNFVKKIILSKMNHKKRFNLNFKNPQIINSFEMYNEMPFPLSSSHRDINYRKINNSNYKTEGRKNIYNSRFPNVLNQNHKNKKRTIEEDNGSKLVIYKSETQYPLSYRKNRNNSRHANGSVIDLNYSPHKKDIKNKFNSISPTYNKEETIDDKKIKSKDIYNHNYKNIVNEKNILYDYKNNAIKINNGNNNYPIEAFSYMTFNNFGDFYQPIKEQINNNTNYYYNNNENIYFNDKKYKHQYNDDKIIIDYSQKFSHLNNTINRDYRYENDEYFQIYKRNNYSNKNKKIENKINQNSLNKDENNDKKLIKVFKKKLIKIFVLFMENFYKNYLKKYFKILISELKVIKVNKKSILKNKINKIVNNDKTIDNNKDNENKEQNKNIFLSSHKKKLTLYKKINKKRNLNNEINKRYIKENEEETIKKSSSNIYIPAKNRISYDNNINNLLGSKTKMSIFERIKIDKSSRLIEKENKFIDLKPKKEKFFNTNKNFYIKKNNTKNNFNIGLKKKKSQSSFQKHKPKMNNINKIIKGKPNTEIKKNYTFYKKYTKEEKINKDIIRNNNNNNKNIYMKKNKKQNISKLINTKLLNRYATNYKIRNNFNSTIFAKNDDNINIFSPDFDNNGMNNSANLSNDVNNYCLDDKPMNMLFLKNTNIYNEEENLNRNEKGKNILYDRDDNFIKENSKEIKNLMQMKTSDKKLYINFNYLPFIDYKKNNNKNIIFLLIISKNDSFTIKAKNNEKRKIKINIKNGIEKLNNIINNCIYINKYLFFTNLRQINSIIILDKQLSSILKNRLRNIFAIFKRNFNAKDKKKYLHVSFKEINPIRNIRKEIKNQKIKKSKIKSINILIDSNNNYNSETNFINPGKINKLHGKEKLKFLIKQIYINNNSDSEKNHFKEGFYDMESEDKNYNGSYEDNFSKGLNINIPLWKSNDFKDFNSVFKNQKTVYLKKNIKQKNMYNDI